MYSTSWPIYHLKICTVFICQIIWQTKKKPRTSAISYNDKFLLISLQTSKKWQNPLMSLFCWAAQNNKKYSCFPFPIQEPWNLGTPLTFQKIPHIKKCKFSRPRSVVWGWVHYFGNLVDISTSLSLSSLSTSTLSISVQLRMLCSNIIYNFFLTRSELPNQQARSLCGENLTRCPSYKGVQPFYWHNILDIKFVI